MTPVDRGLIELEDKYVANSKQPAQALARLSVN